MMNRAIAVGVAFDRRLLAPPLAIELKDRECVMD